LRVLSPSSYDYAVSSASKERALAFLREFSSSHLVGDLIESLPPDVAQQVCAEMQGGGPAKARKACEAMRAALAVQPAAGIVVPAAPVAPVTVAPVEPAYVVTPQPAATTAAAVPDFIETPLSPDDEPEVRPNTGGIGGTGKGGEVARAGGGGIPGGSTGGGTSGGSTGGDGSSG